MYNRHDAAELYLETEEYYLTTTVQPMPEAEELSYSLETIAMIRGLKDIFQVYASLNKKLNKKVAEEILTVTDIDRLIYDITANITLNYVLKQKILSQESIIKRHEELCVLLNREIGIMRIQDDIAQKVKRQVETDQKEYYLREEIKAIHKELGQEDAVSEADHFERKAQKLKAPKKVKKKLKEEINENSGKIMRLTLQQQIFTVLLFDFEITGYFYGLCQ